MVDFLSEIKRIKTVVIAQKARRTLLAEQLQKSLLLKDEQGLLFLNTEKGRKVVQAVAATLQKDLEYQVSNLVTLALASVFDDPMEFKIKFVERRNQIELDMFFVKDGNEYDPMDDGGGSKDIASLALRMAVWSIKKTRAVMILDEPCKFLSRDMQAKASEMIKMLSEELGIQMIVVSHVEEMITSADQIFNVTKSEGISKVTVQ